MEIAEKAQAWIDWSRRNRPSSGSISRINNKDFDFPWLLDDLFGIAVEPDTKGAELLTFFVDALASNPMDIPTRFTAEHARV